jgi:hypothetical protein
MTFADVDFNLKKPLKPNHAQNPFLSGGEYLSLAVMLGICLSEACYLYTQSACPRAKYRRFLLPQYRIETRIAETSFVAPRI